MTLKIRTVTKVTEEQEELEGEIMKGGENRWGNIHLGFVVCLKLVDCGNNLCYFMIEMFSKYFANDCNTVG
jgi:hypothetical protein